MSNISFTLPEEALIKLDKYIVVNNIKNNRGKLLSHASACYSIVMNFVELITNEGIVAKSYNEEEFGNDKPDLYEFE
jgi:hypothetical protein